MANKSDHDAVYRLSMETQEVFTQNVRKTYVLWSHKPLLFHAYVFNPMASQLLLTLKRRPGTFRQNLTLVW